MTEPRSQSPSSETRLPRVQSPGVTIAPTAPSSAPNPHDILLSPSTAYHGKNPFLLPREDVFLLKEKTARAKADAKEKIRQMKIWEKPAKLHDIIHQSADIDTVREGESDDVAQSSYLQRVAARAAFLASSGHYPSHASSSQEISRAAADKQFFPTSHRHSDKVNMTTFIAQKRDMFLLNMSLATKRSEIEKLESRALMKEEALHQAEQMLEEDAMRFDAFLKENDRRAHESLKRAEKEAREKNDCLMELKKINAEIGKVENEMHKYEEQLTLQLKYKQFLDSLTPRDYLAAQQLRRLAKIRDRKKRMAAENQKLNISKLSGESGGNGSMTQRTKGGQSVRTHRQHRDASNISEEKEAMTPRKIRHSSDLNSHRDTGTDNDSDSVSGDQVLLEALDDDLSDDDEPMYFQHPSQLLELFSQLEERNLFLIQNVQETEENLEELRHKFNELDREMAEKAGTLTENIAALRLKIEREEEKENTLIRRKQLMGIVKELTNNNNAAATATDVSTSSSSDLLLSGLIVHVRTVHSKCGFDGDSATDTLDALRDIEGWLEHLLHELKCMDPVKVEAAEKKKNAERRTLIREAKRLEQQKLYEERLAKSAARANAEVVKRVGKPVMFRSAPLKKKKREENVTEVDEEEEERKRFFTV